MNFENVTTRKITNQYAVDFPSEGQSMLLRDAAFAFITNAVEEAIAFNQNKGAVVSASLCKGKEFAFLENGAVYLAFADNGRGVDFDEFFQNGSPDEIKGNHLYRKGVVKALSKLDPNGGGRIVIITKDEAGWVRYDGNFFGGSVTREEDSLGLSEASNTYIFVRVDEKENNLIDLVDFHERLRLKYHYYLVGGRKSLSLKWLGYQIEPLKFKKADYDGYQKWSEDFGSFTLEMERFLASPKKEYSYVDDETCQPHYHGLSGCGGIAIYHNNLFIQDSGFRCIFNSADARKAYAKIRDAAELKKLSERDVILSEGAEVVDCFWSTDNLSLPYEGINLDRDFLDRLRFLVNVKPKDGFVLDMVDTKSGFLWSNALKQVFLAIDSVIGDVVRRYIQTEKELTLKASLGCGLMPTMNLFTGGSPRCLLKMILPHQFNLCIDGHWGSDEEVRTGNKLPETFVVYQADEFVRNDAEKMVQCHSTIIETYGDGNDFAFVNGKTSLPSLNVVYCGDDFDEEVVPIFRDYKASLLAKDQLIAIRIIKLHCDVYDNMEDVEVIEDVVERIIDI